MCVPGEPVELRPEPRNPYDPHAVAVYSVRGVQIGYLSAERAPRIGAMIRQGRDIACVFQGLSRFGGWIRVAFDGDAPTLTAPPAESPAADDDGFWPDPIYDD